MIPYPIVVDAALPERVSRWRPLVHWLLLIPQYIVLWALGVVTSALVFVSWFIGVFTGQIPQGILRFIAMYLRYSARVQSYVLFLHGVYPPFEFEDSMDDRGSYPVRVDVAPEVGHQNRLTIFFRLFMIIPQLFFGILVGIGLWVVNVIGFFAVLILGRWPRGLRDFAIGALRWSIRVNGYYYLLTDAYPPFHLS